MPNEVQSVVAIQVSISVEVGLLPILQEDTLGNFAPWYLRPDVSQSSFIRQSVRCSRVSNELFL